METLLMFTLSQLIFNFGMECREVRPDVYICENEQYICQVNKDGKFCSDAEYFEEIE